jgi:superfamily I DNA and/or RNA helicase
MIKEYRKPIRKIKFAEQGNMLQDIWQLHTDVQEQMLRLRSVSVRVLPESVKVVGEKLYLKADENDKTDRIIDEIATTFKIHSNDINTEEGFFFADIDVTQSTDIEQKKDLSQRAAANFINFQPFPIIDGFINKKKSVVSNLQKFLKKSGFDYTFDKKGRLQISVSDLKKLNKQYISENVNIQIPEIASVVLPIRPNPILFLKKELPGVDIIHKTQSYRKRDKDVEKENRTIQWNRTIEITGGYLKNEILEQFNNEFGLALVGYDYTFEINPDIVSKYDAKTSPYILPKLNEDNSSFTFHTNLRETEKNNDILLTAYNEERWEFNLRYTQLKKFFESFFGEENVKFETKFVYSYDLYKFETDYLKQHAYSKEEFFNIVYTSFLNENVTVSESADNIGIDFNWQTDKIEDVISNIINKCPYVNFSFYKNHRCNIDFQVQDMSLDEAENLLREKFPSIQTKRDDKNGTLYFYQEYQTQEQYLLLCNMIQSELCDFNSDTFDFGLYEIPQHKEKYLFRIDNQSKRDSQKAAVKEIRGADFCVGKNDFGKLFRVNYPQMIFDISGDNFEKTKQLFESKMINSIEPNLTGDIEKINRLKKSLNSILKGENLQNPNLKEFIFDAEKAKKIEDIDFHINSGSDTFQELNNHLLNNKINEPQKQAIIKTLLAEDLALIQGPPGTGKSTAIAEIIWQHIRKNPKERVLLTSETNLAVDNAIDRIVNKNHNLVKPIRIGDEDKLEMEGRQFSLDVMKRLVENGNIEIDEDEQNEDEELLSQKLILQNWIDNIQRRIENTELDNTTFTLWNNILSNPPKQIRQLFYNNYIKNCNVIGATCSSIGKVSSKGKWTNFYWTFQEIYGNNKPLLFTTVIQDESSKATPAELSLPLIYGKKNIIIGDHRQLPPMLDKEEFKMSLDFLLGRTEKDEERQKIIKLKTFVLKHFEEMEISHFERLFEKIDNSLKGVFNLQYRMHPDINDVIKQFYVQDSGLKCGLITPIDMGVNDENMHNPASRYHGIEIDGLISKDTHTIWIDTNSPELLDGTSRTNYGEVEAIRDVLTKLRHSDSFKQYQSFWTNPEDQQIGVISFYGKQIKLLQNLRNEFRDIPIRVSTVDRFQGMERNIIIVSMVRSNRIAADKKQKADTNIYGDLGFPEQKDLGFAQSPNRLNVALSRAKRLLIIVGNSELFRQKEIYNNAYQTIANNPNGKIIKYETL